MTTDEATRRWTDPGWLEEVHTWTDTHLERLGLVRSGETTQPHLRDVWFKASQPALAHEAAVIEAPRRLRS